SAAVAAMGNAMLRAALLALMSLLLRGANAQAQNKPCSGKKGGISHYDVEVFVCNEGLASGSKRSCQAYMGGAPQRAVPAPKAPTSNAACSCAANSYCKGPRGGRYCVTSTGSKRYAS